MRKWFFVSIIAAVLLALVSIAAGPPPQASNGLERAIAAQEGHTDALMSISGVVGTAVGLGADGNAAVMVLAEKAGITGIPGKVDGVPVVVKVTGKIVALGKPNTPPGQDKKPPKEEVDPTTRFDRPVPIGVSSGSERLITIDGVNYCTVGTLGARVKDGDDHVYALSNNHVYALEGEGVIGDRILQPGRVDMEAQACGSDAEINDAVIGTLSDFVPIEFSLLANNKVDAAIAAIDIVQEGDYEGLAVGNATPSDGYGTPTSAIQSAFVGQAVQKYGRTTGLTKGSVTMVNATVNVGYDAGTARFVNQIIVESRKPFIKPGDSGSLLVTDPGKNPIGLLFAGSTTGKLGVANHIDDVLSSFGVTIDGE